MAFTKGHKVNVGRLASLEKRIKISNGNRGKVHSEKLMNILKSRIGNKNPMFGRKQTDIAKDKVRLTKLAEKNPNLPLDLKFKKNGIYLCPPPNKGPESIVNAYIKSRVARKYENIIYKQVKGLKLKYQEQKIVNKILEEHPYGVY